MTIIKHLLSSIIKPSQSTKMTTIIRSISTQQPIINQRSISTQLLRSSPINLIHIPNHQHPSTSSTSTSSFSSTTNPQWKSIGSSKKFRKRRSKLKTHQGAKKRFFVTGSGQFKRAQAGTQHLMTGMSQTRKRRLKPMIIIKRSQTSLIRKLLPYAGHRAGFRRLDPTESVWWPSGKLQKTGLALRSAIQRSNDLKLQAASSSSSSSSSSVPSQT